MGRSTELIVLWWTCGDSARVSSTLAIRVQRFLSLRVSNGTHPEMTVRARSVWRGGMVFPR